MKYVASIAFSATRRGSPAVRPLKPPGVNWAKALERRRPELMTRKNRPQDWNRYTIYDKVTHWFEVIGKELQNPAILARKWFDLRNHFLLLLGPKLWSRYTSL